MKRSFPAISQLSNLGAARYYKTKEFKSQLKNNMAQVLKKQVKLALVQLESGSDKIKNLKNAREKVFTAVKGGANLVVLPECFNSPYGCSFFPTYAETLLPSPPTELQSPSWHALSAMAKDAGCYLVGGSIPELETSTKKYFNTNLTFSPSGELIATHRKVHLFDIDIPGKITFKESEVLSPGNKITIVDLPEYGKIAIAICYDIRFPELAMIAARKGVFCLVYPGAFNTTTGPLHWKLQGQSRAMDNQCFVALCSPARGIDGYQAYGHSLIVDPMANVMTEAGEGEEIVYATLNPDQIFETRNSIPLNGQRRFDVYPDVSRGSTFATRSSGWHKIPSSPSLSRIAIESLSRDMADDLLTSSKISDISWAPSALRSFSVNERRISDEGPPSSLSSTRGILQLSKQILKELPKESPKSTTKPCILKIGAAVAEGRTQEDLGQFPSADSRNCSPSQYVFEKDSISFDQANQTSSPNLLYNVGQKPLDNSNNAGLKSKSKSLSSTASRKSLGSCQLISTLSEPDNDGQVFFSENDALPKGNIQKINADMESKSITSDNKGSANHKKAYHRSDRLQRSELDNEIELQKAMNLAANTRELILKNHGILESNTEEEIQSIISPFKSEEHLQANFNFLLSDEISSSILAVPWESRAVNSRVSARRIGEANDVSILSDYCNYIPSSKPVAHPTNNREIFISPVFAFDSELGLTSPNLPTTKEDLDIASRVTSEDYEKLRRGGISDKYPIILGNSPEVKNLGSTSTSQNVSKFNNPIFREPSFEGPSRNFCEHSSTSPAGSLRRVGTASYYKSIVDQADYNYFDRLGKNTRKKTMQWLKDLLSSTGPYESQLTTLPTRTGSSQYSNNKLFPTSNQEQKAPKSQPSSEAGSSHRDNFHETSLTNTISSLEQLVDEALLIAQRVIENEDSANGPAILDNASKFLKSSRADITKYLNKSSKSNSAHERLQSFSGDNEPYQSDEYETPSSVGNETIRETKINTTGHPRSESSGSSAGYISTTNSFVSEAPQKIKYARSQIYSDKNSEGFLKRQDNESKNPFNISINGESPTERIPDRFRNKPLKPQTTHREAKFPAKTPNLSFSDRLTQILSHHDRAVEQEDIGLEFIDALKYRGEKKSELTSLEPNDGQSCMNNYLEGATEKIDNVGISDIQDLTTPNQLDSFNLDSRRASNGDEIDLNTRSDMKKSTGDKARNRKLSLPYNIVTLQDNPDSGPPRWNKPSYKTNLKPVNLNENRFKESIPTKIRKKQITARDWPPGKKRPVAAVACLSTALVGILVGIYAGETPAIQYYIVDLHHYTILGNVVFFLGLAIPTFFVWPLPLVHGRKPYILGSMSIAMPLLFPQALAVGDIRSPNIVHWRVGLLLSRALMGVCLGFANMNFKSMLTDLFGASLQSSNPYQEHVDEFDVRRHGGGMGIWLGLWTWSTLGSIGIGFLIGAAIIETLPPSWGFYVSIIIIAFVMLLNVVCPELRRSAFKRSVADVVTKDLVFRKSIDGEINLNIAKNGPRWWKEELLYGISLSQKMIRQPGFLIISLYVAWIYAQQVLIIVLVGALMSKDYRFRSPMVGLSVMAMPIGALLAVPFQKASLLSRTRRRLSVNDDSIFLKRKIHWSSHMLRRAIFVLCLPTFGIVYTLLSSGPPIPFILPILSAGVIGFLSNLAMAECNGIIMETFDVSDLQPGMTGRPRGVSGERTAMRRTNYSTFPRVCSAFAIFETFGYIFAAGTSGISGVLTRRLGQQAATGVMAGILLILSILLLGILFRYTEVQIIPDSKMKEMNNYHQARRESQLRREAGLNEDEEPWRPVIIGNPNKSTRKICLLELGSMSRYSEIRKKNRLIDKTSLEARHPNRNALNSWESELKRNIRRSASRSSRDSHRRDALDQSGPGKHKNIRDKNK
ncbi:hypothetical protein K3495_g5274 [Podosphaera aphanis]|nr:hypothetical protein K3495_g5274 [Podosphaera aphanis]